MSDYEVGDRERDWVLRERHRHDSRVELWYNTKSHNYGVYVYEEVKQPKQWILFVIRKTEDEARTIFDTIAGMLR